MCINVHVAQSLACSKISDEKLGLLFQEKTWCSCPPGVSRQFHHQAMEKFEVRLTSLCTHILLHPYCWNPPWLLWSICAFDSSLFPHGFSQKPGKGHCTEMECQRDRELLMFSLMAVSCPVPNTHKQFLLFPLKLFHDIVFPWIDRLFKPLIRSGKNQFWWCFPCWSCKLSY